MRICATRNKFVIIELNIKNWNDFKVAANLYRKSSREASFLKDKSTSDWLRNDFYDFKAYFVFSLLNFIDSGV